MVARARIEDDDFQLKVARDDIPPKRSPNAERAPAVNDAAAEAARRLFCDDGICAAPTTNATGTPARAPGLTFFTLHNTTTKKTTEP
ncbi:MAG TPA: hypothetical protein VGF99_20175 [Myxococcota bacterium]